jgi:hypothetical protein
MLTGSLLKLPRCHAIRALLANNTTSWQVAYRPVFRRYFQTANMSIGLCQRPGRLLWFGSLTKHTLRGSAFIPLT